MSQTFGIEAPSKHEKSEHRPPARYLVIIEAAGAALARCFLASRQQVAEFDASTEEVAAMTRGLTPVQGASGPEWDAALDSHSAAERAAAQVYELDV